MNECGVFQWFKGLKRRESDWGNPCGIRMAILGVYWRKPFCGSWFGWECDTKTVGSAVDVLNTKQLWDPPSVLSRKLKIHVSSTEKEDHPKENMNIELLKVSVSQEKNYRIRSIPSFGAELEQHDIAQ